jgi:hypothetical protein
MFCSGVVGFPPVYFGMKLLTQGKIMPLGLYRLMEGHKLP